MAAEDRLGVEGRDGVSVHRRVTAAGYTYLTIGEHLVSGPRTPAEFIDHCLRTDGLRRTLTDPSFTHAGVARADAPRGTTYWTALWAAPLTPAGLSRTAADVIDLTNRARARAGLPPLASDPVLTRAAQAHSADMVARDFSSHTAPRRQPALGPGRGRRLRPPVDRREHRLRPALPADVVTGWLNSPGHRANILRPGFTHIGVGFAGGGRAGTYWTQLFGGD
ncbi:hypothetical protein GCM10020295_06410 [Streptomyces cinereospinus]